MLKIRNQCSKSWWCIWIWLCCSWISLEQQEMVWQHWRVSQDFSSHSTGWNMPELFQSTFLIWSTSKNKSWIWTEFPQGNFVVNKSDIPFCAIGPDHGIEHVNRSMKVSGGLVGITLNEAARSRFFLVAPELSRLAQKAKDLICVKKESTSQHHGSSPRFARSQDTQVIKLRREIANHMNPFNADSETLVTIATKTVMPQKVTQDLTHANQIGLSIFGPRWQRQPSMYGKTKVKVADQIVELKSERSLFARLVVVARSRSDINIKESIGKFTTFPRSLLDDF